MSSWRLLRDSAVDFRLGMGRTAGACACGQKATEVVKYPNGDLGPFCKPCRQRALGLTLKEKASLKTKQGDLF